MSEIQKIHRWLIENNKTLALAESCTGGYLSSLFTSIPDASKYFLGCLVTYSNDLKHDLLKVSRETLLKQGAVSRETANEMLLGLMKITKADLGIAITGIAGPSGGSKEKPVGTVYIALEIRGEKPHGIECHFAGDRKEIIKKACERTLSELVVLLKK